MESGISSLALRKKDFSSHPLYIAPRRPTKVSPQAGIKQSLPWKVPPLSCGRRNPVTKWSPLGLHTVVTCASLSPYLPLILSQTLKQTCLLEEAFLVSFLIASQTTFLVCAVTQHFQVCVTDWKSHTKSLPLPLYYIRETALFYIFCPLYSSPLQGHDGKYLATSIPLGKPLICVICWFPCYKHPIMENFKVPEWYHWTLGRDMRLCISTTQVKMDEITLEAQIIVKCGKIIRKWWLLNIYIVFNI